MSRLNELLLSTPPATLGFLGLIGFIYVLQLILDIPLDDYSLRASLVLQSSSQQQQQSSLSLNYHQWYRCITSTVMHASILHLGMNSMSLITLGTQVERYGGGTTNLVLTTACSMVGTPIIHITVAYLSYAIFGYSSWYWKESSVGFSGILFHWSVLEAATNAGTSTMMSTPTTPLHESSLTANQNTRSVFGMFRVASIHYPWVLLVVLQIFIPNLSFVGHLSGLLMGTIQVYILQTPILYHAWTERQLQRILSSSSNGVPTTNTPTMIPAPIPLSTSTTSTTATATMTRAIQNMCFVCTTTTQYIGWILETIQVIVFGQSTLTTTSAASTTARRSCMHYFSFLFRSNNNRNYSNNNHAMQMVDLDDDEWIGLPTVNEGEDEDASTTSSQMV